jgi:hypothetical protein
VDISILDDFGVVCDGRQGRGDARQYFVMLDYNQLLLYKGIIR